MRKINNFNSIVDSNIINEIENAKWCTDLIQFATTKCNIDGLIASAYLFCPEIVQINEYVFIKRFLRETTEETIKYINNLEKQYNNDRKQIEMSINTWSIGDFFVGDTNVLMDNKEIIYQFGKALVYFWKNRVKELFPKKNMVVELGENLMGELGLCITMYEDE